MKLGDAFLHYSDASLSVLGLTLFLAVFIGSIFWTSLKFNRKKYAEIASMVLDDDEDRVLSTATSKELK